MVTASHNPPLDNGIKLLTSTGALFSPAAVALLNDALEATISIPSLIPCLLPLLNAPVPALSSAPSSLPHPGLLLVFATDTRLSSPSLLSLLLPTHVPHVILGYASTPELSTCLSLLPSTPQQQLRASYLAPYVSALAALSSLLSSPFATPSAPPAPLLPVDCAMGVAAFPLRALLASLPPDTLSLFNVPPLNDAGTRALLNTSCGSDFILTSSSPPATHTGPSPASSALCASVDGDGDRLIFYRSAPFLALTGDHIAALLATFLRPLLPAHFTLAVVATAYANSSFLLYLRELGITPVITATGVAHLHHAAQEADLGIYYEPNGHGTVLFSDSLRAALVQNEGHQLQVLRCVLELSHQTVGDAIPGLLLVPLVLRHLNVSVDEWAGWWVDRKVYQSKVSAAARARATEHTIACYYARRAFTPDNAARATEHTLAGSHARRAFTPENAALALLRATADSLAALASQVGVLDKSRFHVSPDETKVVEPAEMQADIDAVRGACRCFVRASGTEDVVRVYVEEGVDGGGGEAVREKLEAVVKKWCGARSKM
jgi:phosphoacetylglucosamine mutase